MAHQFITGIEVDLAFKKNKKFFGVNLIGYPGAFEAALPMDGYKILNRAGLKTFPLPYTYWKFDQQNCMKELMLFSDG